MRFADFRDGLVIEHGPQVLDEASLVDFARQHDPQWFHTDAERAAGGRWQGLIASGWHTCAIAMRLAVEAALDGSESFASPGLAYVKWPQPVRAGDALTLRATVIEARRSERKPSLGILRWRWELFNQHGAQVLELEATSLFDLGLGRAA